MKFPAKPPVWDSIDFSDKGSEYLVKMLGLADPELYFHWDKLRHRQAPAGYSAEEWWLAVRTRRHSRAQAVPLKDKLGNAFNFSIPESVQKPLHEIDLGAGGHIRMPEQITNEQTRDQYFIKSLVHEAISSSQLEGAVTTREVAKEMIRSGRKPADKSEQMIMNNFLTMRHINRIKKKELSPNLVFEIHRKVTEGTLNDEGASGRFRTVDEPVHVVDDEDNQILHDPPHASELPDRMQELCNFANCTESDVFIHPVVRAIIVHFWLAYDHPFVDGNGRTARALFYWCMLHNQYWLFEFISISGIIQEGPKKYARAFLYTETDENDLNYFIIHQLEVIRRAIASLHDYIDRKVDDTKKLERRLKGMSVLNHRQRELIIHALKHPFYFYTYEGHAMSHNVVRQTARNDLLKLEELGLLTKEKRGNKRVFLAIADLSEAIQNIV